MAQPGGSEEVRAAPPAVAAQRDLRVRDARLPMLLHAALGDDRGAEEHDAQAGEEGGDRFQHRAQNGSKQS